MLLKSFWIITFIDVGLKLPNHVLDYKNNFKNSIYWAIHLGQLCLIISLSHIFYLIIFLQGISKIIAFFLNKAQTGKIDFER